MHYKTCLKVHRCTISHLQISKRWKLQSIEQQQKELEAKREAKAQAKKVSGNGDLTFSKCTISKVMLLIVF